MERQRYAACRLSDKIPYMDFVGRMIISMDGYREEGSLQNIEPGHVQVKAPNTQTTLHSLVQQIT